MRKFFFDISIIKNFIYNNMLRKFNIYGVVKEQGEI